MGGAPTDSIKKLISVKFKPRQDSYTDQFNRLFMVRMFLVASLLTGLDWMTDEINCLVPKDYSISKSFVSNACWMNGVYIYRNIHGENQSYYYGIPDDINHDGINKFQQPCATVNNAWKKNTECKPLQKTFFLQYQWFPIAIAAFGFLYYLPYLLFCLVNTDLDGLKAALSESNIDYKKIVKKYFDYKVNKPKRLRLRVLMIVAVKLLYLLANILTFLMIDAIFNGGFSAYGSEYTAWAGLSNEKAHEYFGKNLDVKAGSKFLPGFGICEVQESARDMVMVVTNKYRLVCEMSQHVVYQYTLVVLWFMLVCGIVVSILGFVYHIFDHFFHFCRNRGSDVLALYKKLTVRERQYLEYIRRKNMTHYGDLVRAIIRERNIEENDKADLSSSSDDGMNISGKQERC